MSSTKKKLDFTKPLITSNPNFSVRYLGSLEGRIWSYPHLVAIKSLNMVDTSELLKSANDYGDTFGEDICIKNKPNVREIKGYLVNFKNGVTSFFEKKPTHRESIFGFTEISTTIEENEGF